jgi:hypothetical protein
MGLRVRRLWSRSDRRRWGFGSPGSWSPSRGSRRGGRWFSGCARRHGYGHRLHVLHGYDLRRDGLHVLRGYGLHGPYGCGLHGGEGLPGGCVPRGYALGACGLHCGYGLRGG